MLACMFRVGHKNSFGKGKIKIKKMNNSSMTENCKWVHLMHIYILLQMEDLL